MGLRGDGGGGRLAARRWRRARLRGGGVPAVRRRRIPRRLGGDAPDGSGRGSPRLPHDSVRWALEWCLALRRAAVGCRGGGEGALSYVGSALDDGRRGDAAAGGGAGASGGLRSAARGDDRGAADTDGAPADGGGG